MIRLAQRLHKFKRTPFKNRSSWLIAPLGGAAGVCTLYYAKVLTEVTPPLIEATNKAGLTWLGLALWVIVGLLAVQMWFHGCVAKRCHEVLYKRMFP